jgi:hypothetical protein
MTLRINGSDLTDPIRSAHFTGLKSADKSDRAWFVVAGGWFGFFPPVPDGTGNQWDDGSYERIESKNRAALKAAGII